MCETNQNLKQNMNAVMQPVQCAGNNTCDRCQAQENVRISN